MPIDCKLVFYTTERVEICFNQFFCRFYGTSLLNFNWKVSSSFTDPNDSQAESENNFVANLYMMEVEDDNVYFGRMTTDVSGDRTQS